MTSFFPAGKLYLANWSAIAFGDLTLDRKNVSQLAIKAIGPKTWESVAALISLHGHVHGINLASCTLPSRMWATPSCRAISGRFFRRALITPEFDVARDDLQIGNSWISGSESRPGYRRQKYAFLSAFFFTQIFKGQPQRSTCCRFVAASEVGFPLFSSAG